MIARVALLMLLMRLLPACSTVTVSNYSTFALRFGTDHPKLAKADGWYQVPLRLEWNAELDHPFVPRAKTARAPMYQQLVHLRGNTAELPVLYCDYVFTFDQKDRLRSVAAREGSCSRSPV